MVVGTDPEKFDELSIVQVDTDAADHAQALREIDDWAHEHGFVRTPEYWLRQIHRRDGQRVYRGICYRISEDELHTIRDTNVRLRAELEKQAPTPHFTGAHNSLEDLCIIA